MLNRWWLPGGAAGRWLQDNLCTGILSQSSPWCQVPTRQPAPAVICFWFLSFFGWEEKCSHTPGMIYRWPSVRDLLPSSRTLWLDRWQWCGYKFRPNHPYSVPFTFCCDQSRVQTFITSLIHLLLPQDNMSSCTLRGQHVCKAHPWKSFRVWMLRFMPSRFKTKKKSFLAGHKIHLS